MWVQSPLQPSALAVAIETVGPKWTAARAFVMSTTTLHLQAVIEVCYVPHGFQFCVLLLHWGVLEMQRGLLPVPFLLLLLLGF